MDTPKLIRKTKFPPFRLVLVTLINFFLPCLFGAPLIDFSQDETGAELEPKVPEYVKKFERKIRRLECPELFDVRDNFYDRLDTTDDEDQVIYYEDLIDATTRFIRENNCKRIEQEEEE